MLKLARGLALVAAMVAVSATAVSVAEAQTKGKKSSKSSGIVEINEGKDGKFRFVVRDSEGKFLAMSSPGGYATKTDAEKGLETLKEALESPTITSGKSKSKLKSKDSDKDSDK